MQQDASECIRCMANMHGGKDEKEKPPRGMEEPREQMGKRAEKALVGKKGRAAAGMDRAGAAAAPEEADAPAPCQGVRAARRGCMR